MAKIDTAWIKNNLLPNGGKDWKRVSSRKFTYNNLEFTYNDFDKDEDITIKLDGKLSWRKYHNEEEYEDFYVIHDETEVLYSGTEALLPPSVYTWSIDFGNYIPQFWIGYRDEYESIGGASDDLRDDDCAGLMQIFKDNGIHACNCMENCWELADNGFDWDLGQDAYIDRLKAFLAPYGLEHSPESDGNPDDYDAESIRNEMRF